MKIGNPTVKTRKDGTKVVVLPTWKPVQTGVIMATSSILYLQNYLLNSRGYRFVLRSRFSQDFLENLFSSVRARQAVPHALAFKNTLKVVTIAQYCRDAPGSSYDHDDCEYLLDFLSFTKGKTEERNGKGPGEDSCIEIPRASNVDIERFPLKDKLVIYDFSGAVMASAKKVYKVCDVCLFLSVPT